MGTAYTISSCDSTLGRRVGDFLTEGLAVELALGIVFATAFSKVVNSLLEDIVTPPLACLGGDVALRDRFKVCRERRHVSIETLEFTGLVAVGEYASLEEAEAAGVNVNVQVSSLDEAMRIGLNTINWGNFIHVIVNFILIVLILALFVIFFSSLRCTARSLRRKEKKAVTV